jgi:hypothetical protein
MTVFYSVSIKKRLLCDCSAYKHPHEPNKRNCNCSVPFELDIPVKASRSYIAYSLKNHVQ